MRWSVPARDVLANAERRVFSALTMIDDDAYTSGLERLRGDVAADPDAPIAMASSFLRVDAVKTAGQSV